MRGKSAKRKVQLYLIRANQTRKCLAMFSIIQTLSQTLITGTGNCGPGRREVDRVCALHLLPAETGMFQARCCWALLLSSSKISLIKGLIIPTLEWTYPCGYNHILSLSSGVHALDIYLPLSRYWLALLKWRQAFGACENWEQRELAGLGSRWCFIVMAFVSTKRHFMLVFSPVKKVFYSCGN